LAAVHVGQTPVTDIVHLNLELGRGWDLIFSAGQSEVLLQSDLARGGGGIGVERMRLPMLRAGGLGGADAGENSCA